MQGVPQCNIVYSKVITDQMVYAHADVSRCSSSRCSPAYSWHRASSGTWRARLSFRRRLRAPRKRWSLEGDARLADNGDARAAAVHRLALFHALQRRVRIVFDDAESSPLYMANWP